MRCQSDPEAMDVGLRPLEAEIAPDTGRRGLVGVPLEEILLSQVTGLGGQVLQPEV